MKDTSADIPIQAQEKKGDAMEVGDIEDLPKLFISLAEKFMDEFNGNVQQRFKRAIQNSSRKQI